MPRHGRGHGRTGRYSTRQRAEVDWNRGASGPQASALPPIGPPTRALLGNLPEQADGLILDLACGAGSPALEAARRNPGARVLGVDQADKLIDTARALAAAHAIGNADFGYLTELAAPGLRERLLREAGISTLHTEMFSWQVPMPSAAAIWAVISAPVPFGRALDGLASNDLEIVQSELAEATAEFRAADGTYTFPMACRLFWGSK